MNRVDNIKRWLLQISSDHLFYGVMIEIIFCLKLMEFSMAFNNSLAIRDNNNN
ncbi:MULTISPECIES: hypothetical protein [unclassified Clostridium]|uniref:hypothetical protein n=1 Tax=unclassified Clostridium TaxID=2614128 RepID=UPI003F924530